MTRRSFALACWVLLFAVSLPAQRAASKADPVSGTWKGTLDVPMASDPLPVTLELKFDGKSKITGTFAGLPNPGEVKTGSFDPATGALKLQLGKTDDSAVLIVLEGSLVKGVATGKVSGEGGNGTFKIAKKAA
jgi:hypothetical protein